MEIENKIQAWLFIANNRVNSFCLIYFGAATIMPVTLLLLIAMIVVTAVIVLTPVIIMTVKITKKQQQ